MIWGECFTVQLIHIATETLQKSKNYLKFQASPERENWKTQGKRGVKVAKFRTKREFFYTVSMKKQIELKNKQHLNYHKLSYFFCIYREK